MKKNEMTVPLSKLRRVVELLKDKSGSTPITLEFVLGSFFPKGRDQLDKLLNDVHMEGYLQGLGEQLNPQHLYADDVLVQEKIKESMEKVQKVSKLLGSAWADEYSESHFALMELQKILNQFQASAQEYITKVEIEGENNNDN